MIVVLKKTEENRAKIDLVKQKIESAGYQARVWEGSEKFVVGCLGIGDKEKDLFAQQIRAIDGVESVISILKPYKLASLDSHPERSQVSVDNDVVIGGKEIVVMAGPCAVETEEQILAIAEAVKKAGAKMLRGGAFKPRTSPYSFQGLKEDGLKMLQAAKEKTGLKIVTEVMDPRDIELVSKYSDMLQIGARSMQNFYLLKEVGQSNKPILLKRGLAATIQEFLMAAEYVLSEGNRSVVLCERGIRTFVTDTRNTLDLNSVPLIKERTHLPIVVDPSHGTGKWTLVPPMSLGAVAVGADGLIIEVHPDPEKALSDGPQALKPDTFSQMMEELRKVAEAVGRTLPCPIAE